MIGQILPGLLELYQWLHTELADALSYENTKKTTISKVAKAIAKESHGDEDKTYEKLKGSSASYFHSDEHSFNFFSSAQLPTTITFI